MQHDPSTFDQILWATKKDYADNVLDAYCAGLTDAWVALTRANFIKPSHVGSAALEIQACEEHAAHATNMRRIGQLVNGVDL